MPTQYVRGDIFSTPGIDMVAHGVNLRGLMGAGIAGTIARKFPFTKARYVSWCETKPSLGDILVDAGGYRPDDVPIFVHMATQGDIGACARIDAIAKALEKLAGWLRDHADMGVTLAIPTVGCGIGGLEWADVKPTVEFHMGRLSTDVLVFEEYVNGVPAEPLR